MWLARLDVQQEGETVVMPLPPSLSAGEFGAALANLAANILNRGKTLTIVVPNDDLAPAIANGLDPALRPLCLMLPAADFAVRIVVRTTISLLKSRLSGSSDHAHSGIWTRQQQRIDADPRAWQDCLDWAENLRGDEPWPLGIAALFPLRVVAVAQIAALAGDKAEFAVVVSPAPTEGVVAARYLLLQARGPQKSVGASNNDQVLRAQLAILSQEIGHMEMELATVQAEVGEFARRYYEQVGALIAELDSLQAELALRRAEQAGAEETTARTAADDATFRAERSRHEQARFAESAPIEPRPFSPSSALKRLYRQIAQKVHPDRAINEQDRIRRTSLMSEANRAYRAADETSLREVLSRWQAGGTNDQPAPAAAEIRLQLERLKRRLSEIQFELRQIFASRLYELFVATRLARRRGRDLLEEMASDLAMRIAALKRTLRE
jgi:hypothetical protein